jgi:hypothetical protein
MEFNFNYLEEKRFMAKTKRTTAIDKVLEKLSLAATGGEAIEGMTEAQAIRSFIQLSKVQTDTPTKTPSKMSLKEQLRRAEAFDEQTATKDQIVANRAKIIELKQRMDK